VTHDAEKDGKRKRGEREERPAADLLLELPVEVDATTEGRKAVPPRAAPKGRFTVPRVRRGQDH
jgi:hypothetical protein